MQYLFQTSLLEDMFLRHIGLLLHTGMGFHIHRCPGSSLGQEGVAVSFEAVVEDMVVVVVEDGGKK